MSLIACLALALTFTSSSPGVPQDVALVRGAEPAAPLGPSGLLEHPARLNINNALLAEALAELNRRAGAPWVALGTAAEPIVPPSSGDAVALAASAAGTINGLVVESRSRRPLAGAQVHILGTRTGALTNAVGGYVMTNVPDGEHTVQAVMLGYRTQEQRVVVRSGETHVLNFELVETAISLDEILVTGTPGGTQRRALGHAIERMDAVEVVEASPSTSLQQVLAQRMPGVMVLPGSGMIGTGSVTRIRGVSSMALTNNPIVLVDGIRIDSEPATGPPLRQGAQVNRMNDLNLDEIESIEVIKGPAAATLYGTEASNGVIQIITKKGRQGESTLDVSVIQGANWFPDPEGRILWTYFYNRATSVRDSVHLYQREAAAGNHIFQTGPIRTYNASLRGGTERVRYYASVDADDSEGILDYNWNKKFGARGNLTLVPNEQWEVETSLGFIRSKTRFGQAAAGFGIWDMFIYGSPSLLNTPTRGFRYATPETAGLIESLSEVDRFIGSFKVVFRPVPWLTHRIVLGQDIVNQLDSQLFPRVPEGEINFFGARGVGSKYAALRHVIYTTLDYSASANFTVSPTVRTTTSFGAQYVGKTIGSLTAQGDNFAAPGITAVGGAGTTRAGEDLIENKTLGFYVQQEADWRNRVFLTAALRGDANSAFGSEFRAAYYPKLSATWVVSDEDFWSIDWVNTLRLRSAWGQAGQQPDVFAALTLYDATVGPGGAPAITPRVFGNPKLKPEVGSEVEIGFDAGMLDERVNAAVTYYWKTTRDAIVAQPVKPSLGFPGTQMVNLGEVRNWGLELQMTGQVVQTSRGSWELGVTFATHKNRIESLGGLPPIVFGDQQHRAGYPIASIFHERVVNAEYDAKGKLVNVRCDGGAENNHAQVDCTMAPKLYWGQPNATWSGTVTNTLRVGQNLQLYGLIDFRGGHTYISGDLQGPVTVFANTTTSAPMTDPFIQAYRDVVPRAPIGMYDAGFAKLREVSATYSLPSSWTRGPLKRASVSVAWRNVATLWVAQKETWGEPIMEPEIRTPGSEHAARFQTVLPPVSQLISTFRLTF